MSNDVYQKSVELHRINKGKLSVVGKTPIESMADLALLYTPGVAEPCRVIARDPSEASNLTWKSSAVAVLSDGSSVLGLGDIGALAGLPVMEGKALIMAQFANLNAVPLVVDVHDSDGLVALTRAVAPNFGAINLEDIAAPKCFVVEDQLQDLGIPIFHDDQHGTAIVVSAALQNASKVVGKRYEDLKVVISGSGAAGIGIAQLLLGLDRKNGEFIKCNDVRRVRDVVLVDSKSIVSYDRDDLDHYKKALAKISNNDNLSGSLSDAMNGADVFVGVSRGGIVTQDMVKSMNHDAIVLAMANPEPEIMPDLAYKAGAKVVGTGRSDFPNQVNNSLAFPGIFKGALQVRAPRITMKMQIAASTALANMVEPTKSKILPDMMQKSLVDQVADAVERAYKEDIYGK